jgi:hypothetical protein
MEGCVEAAFVRAMARTSDLLQLISDEKDAVSPEDTAQTSSVAACPKSTP